MRYVGQQPAAGQQRKPVLPGERPRAMLETEIAHLGRSRSDESDAGSRAILGKGCVLAEKPVTGVDRLRARGARGFEQLVLPQVAVLCGGTAKRYCFIGKTDMQRIAVDV